MISLTRFNPRQNVINIHEFPPFFSNQNVYEINVKLKIYSTHYASKAHYFTHRHIGIVSNH